MFYFNQIVLAIIQGITEFAPISSSAHLILANTFLDLKNNLFMYSIALHSGTLLATILYFKKDIKKMLMEIVSISIYGKYSEYSLLALELLLATVPVGIFGLLFKNHVAYMQDTTVVAFCMLLFGILLYLADYFGKKNIKTINIGFGCSLLIGLAQSIAIIPGVSRSGIVLTAALALGLSRANAVRFTFLLSIPTVGAASLYNVYTLNKALEVVSIEFDYLGLLLGFLVSALTGYIFINFFIKLLNKFGMLPFAIYRCILGLVLLATITF